VLFHQAASGRFARIGVSMMPSRKNVNVNASSTAMEGLDVLRRPGAGRL